MTTKSEKETKQEVTTNEADVEVAEKESTPTSKGPVNPNAYVLSQAAFQLYTSAAHSKDDVAERLKLLEAYLVKVNAEE
jgi:hypothetical protein